MWIKEALEDKTADLRIGWDKKYKRYDQNSRLAIVVNDYVVIVWLRNKEEGKFVTAYQADNSIGKILTSPRWKPLK